MHLQVGSGDDDGSATVIDPLAEEILPKAALFAPQEVREGLEPVVVAARDRTSPAAVVDEGVDRLLKHALFVTHDYLGRLQLDEPLEPVVSVDDTAVQVVQIAGSEAPTVQLHHGTQLRRQYRQHGKHHPLGLVAAAAKRLYHAQAFDGFLAPLARGAAHLVL